jgi:hypothetical protein
MRRNSKRQLVSGMRKEESITTFQPNLADYTTYIHRRSGKEERNSSESSDLQVTV